MTAQHISDILRSAEVKRDLEARPDQDDESEDGAP